MSIRESIPRAKGSDPSTRTIDRGLLPASSNPLFPSETMAAKLAWASPVSVIACMRRVSRTSIAIKVPGRWSVNQGIPSANTTGQSAAEIGPSE